MTAGGVVRSPATQRGALRVAAGLESSTPLALTQEQFDALIVGLPWQRLHERRVITRV